jgi:3-oxoacyl-[acyl-carrier-protein] synthase-3
MQSQTVNEVLHNPNSSVSDMSQVDDCLIHTGSKKILDGVCSQLHLDTDSTKVEKSYDVLENFGNLSSASTGFMLAARRNGPGRRWWLASAWDLPPAQV